MRERAAAECKLRLVMMGTGPFAVPSFEALRAAGHEIVMVVTRPQPATKSRKGPPASPVRNWAIEQGLSIFDPQSINDPSAIEQLRPLLADLLVVCDYGQILKPEALAVARLGGINLHGSLLPAYRGAAPVQRAMLSGDRVTGVSVIHMTPRLDAGPILSTRQTAIRDQETAGDLEERLSLLGVEATQEAVDCLCQNGSETSLGSPQEAEKATRAPRLSKSEGLIDWNRPARLVDCHVRGMQPWPVAYCFFPAESNHQPVRLAIKQVQIGESLPSNAVPGDVCVSDGFRVATQDHWIRITMLQPAGKREMAAEEFLRGHQPGLGANLQPAADLGTSENS